MKPLTHSFNRQQFEARKKARAGTVEKTNNSGNSVPKLRDAVAEMQVALGLKLTAPE